MEREAGILEGLEGEGGEPHFLTNPEMSPPPTIALRALHSQIHGLAFPTKMN